MSQRDLFAPGVVDAAPVVGDELDRMLTQGPLAELCLDRVLQRCPVSAVKLVVEPSVGGGAFVRAARKRLPKATVWGVDLDPTARGLELVDRSFVGVDTLDWAREVDQRPQLIVGNPPFGPALEHVEALLALRPYRLALILPWDRVGRKGWHDVFFGEPVEGMTWREVHPIRPRPWGQHVREVALFVWGQREPYVQRVLGNPLLWKASGKGVTR